MSLRSPESSKKMFLSVSLIAEAVFLMCLFMERILLTLLHRLNILLVQYTQSYLNELILGNFAKSTRSHSPQKQKTGLLPKSQAYSQVRLTVSGICSILLKLQAPWPLVNPSTNHSHKQITVLSSASLASAPTSFYAKS